MMLPVVPDHQQSLPLTFSFSLLPSPLGDEWKQGSGSLFFLAAWSWPYLPQPGCWSFLLAPPLQNVPIVRTPPAQHPTSLGVVIRGGGAGTSAQGWASPELGISTRQLIASHAHFPLGT